MQKNFCYICEDINENNANYHYHHYLTAAGEKIACQSCQTKLKDSKENTLSALYLVIEQQNQRLRNKEKECVETTEKLGEQIALFEEKTKETNQMRA